MVIKIGKLSQINVSIQLYFLLVFYTLSANQISIELSLTDLRAHAIAKTELDQPVLLTIKINGLSTSVPLSIEGIEHFNAEPRGSFKQYYSFNGNNTQLIEHRYLLRPQKIGSFNIGPVTLVYNNETIRSNSCELEVQNIDEYHPLDSSSPIDQTFIEFFPKKTTGFVGEKIPITLRLNSSKPIEPIECLLPKVNKEIITFSSLEKISEKQKTISNQKYNCIEWSCNLEVKKAGHHVIPELIIVYNTIKHNSFSDNFFDQFFGRSSITKQKKVFGKEFTITINELPPNEKNLNGIGMFESFSASLDKSSIMQGNGCVLSLTLKGQSPLDDIKPPRLTLPTELKYYESACHSKKSNEKVFEYIIQGIKPGIWSIPSQEFTFFDTDKAEYCTLTTEPLSLTVQQDKVATPKASMHDSNNEDHQADAQILPADNSCEIMPIYENSPWYPIKKRSLSLPFFIGLCCIPLLYLFYLFIVYKRTRYAQYNMQYLKHKQAFIHARKRLNAAKKSQSITQLHDIFIELFAQRCNIQPSLINQEAIEQCLSKAHCTQALLEQWNRFFSELSEITYAKQEKIDTHALFNRAYVWLDQLEEFL